MKILITTDTFAPDMKGAAIHAGELADRLAQRGHTVTVLTLSARGNEERQTKRSFRVVRIKQGNAFMTCWRLVRWYRRHIQRFDVAYSFSPYLSGGPLALVAPRRHVPLLVRVGEDVLWERYCAAGNPAVSLADFYAEGLYRKDLFRYFWIRRVLRAAEQVIVPSERFGAFLERWYCCPREEQVVIKNPLPSFSIEAPRSISGRAKEIVYAGRLDAVKNVATLLHAFARVDAPGWRLRIIGDGPRREHLERITMKLDIEERVSFEQPREKQALFESILHSAFLVLPSWSDISPNIIIECYAIGIPFLLTKEHYLPIGKTTMRTLDPASIEDTANAIRELMDPDTYSRHVQTIAKLPLDQRWKDVVRAHERIIQKVTKEEE